MGLYGGGDTTVVQAPPAPDYAGSMREILTSQVELAPRVYESEAKYQPLYNKLQAEQQGYLAQESLKQAAQMFPQVANIEAAYTAANRAAELSQLQQALPQYQQAFSALTPGYTEAIGAAGKLAQQSMQGALNRPAFNVYTNTVRDPYGTSTAARMPSLPSPAQSLAATPAAAAGQRTAVPQAAPGAQPGGLRETVAGGYVNAVQGFNPMNVAQQAGAVPDAANMRGIAGPALASNIQNLDANAVKEYLQTMPGMEAYANTLSAQANQELAAGRSLTAEEQRLADQAARSAYAARGMALGPQAVAAEVLNRADVANQRFQQRMATAQSAMGQVQGIYQPALQQSLQRQQLGIEYGLSKQQQAFAQAQARDAMAQQIQAQRYGQLMGQQQLEQAAQNQAYAQAMGREELGATTQQAAFQQALQRGQAEQQAYMAGVQGQAAEAQLGAGALGQLQTAQAPVLQAFYKQPILQGQTGASQQMGVNMSQLAGPQYFNPESQTGMGSIYGAYNAQMNLAGAQAQANAAKQAGKSSMLGSIGGGLLTGAALALCWVAREVYGTENPKWTQFRDWMLANASDDFVDTYIQHGPKIAEFISDKPELKNMIRSWMDSKIS
jgi:hypothetical protein